MGIRSCPAAELVFEGALVPAANRLGGEGDGYRVALSALGDGRIGIAAACTGLARSALEQAAAYLGERKAFGAPIAELQGLRFMVAEMARDVAAARALTRGAAAPGTGPPRRPRSPPLRRGQVEASGRGLDAGHDGRRPAVRVCDTRGGGVERLMRDAKGAQIYEGTSPGAPRIVATRSGPGARVDSSRCAISAPNGAASRLAARTRSGGSAGLGR